MSRSSPCPHLVLSQSGKQISTPSGMCTCGFQSRHPLTAAALSSRTWGALSSPPCSRPRSYMPCYTVSRWSPGGTRPKSVASLEVLRRSRSLRLSIPSHGSAPSPAHESMLGQAGPLTAPSAPPWSSPSYPRPPAALLLQTAWLRSCTPGIIANSCVHAFRPHGFYVFQPILF